jgi:hypothetical protein
MAGFDTAWAAVNHAKNGEAVSSDLSPLLQRVYSEVLAVPTNLPALKDGLTRSVACFLHPDVNSFADRKDGKRHNCRSR